MKSSPLLVLVAWALASCALKDANGRGARQRASATSMADRTPGRTLFLRNCAHCHGADARGDEGPNLHQLDWTDERIATRIRNGKKGEMTAFAEKLSADDIRSVVTYLRGLE